MLQDIIGMNLAPLVGNLYMVKAISLVVIFVLIAILALSAQYLVREFMLIIVKLLLKRRSHSVFLQEILKNNSIKIFAHLVAGLIFLCGSNFVTQHSEIDLLFIDVLHKFAQLYIFVMVVFILTKAVQSLDAYYQKKVVNADRYPISSYLKVLSFVIWIVSGVLIIAFFMNTSPVALLTGIGAVSAIFLLVFKDTLLGIVASIQATALNIVRVGDRINIDKFGLEGEVLDISINTVRIRNSDNTTAHIPTYMLTSEIVRNWRSMYDSGARRIKRSINLDINTINVCSSVLLHKLCEFKVVSDYVRANPADEYINLALYRVYIQHYLMSNKSIHKGYPILIRHLESSVYGLPVEIYVFTNQIVLAQYEAVQADIFEHLFSSLALFELKVLQSSSGN